MSESVQIACADILGIALCATMCIALTGLLVVGIICTIKWLKGDFKDD
jgi:hypothetical protein